MTPINAAIASRITADRSVPCCRAHLPSSSHMSCGMRTARSGVAGLSGTMPTGCEPCVQVALKVGDVGVVGVSQRSPRRVHVVGSVDDSDGVGEQLAEINVVLQVGQAVDLGGLLAGDAVDDCSLDVVHNLDHTRCIYTAQGVAA